MIAVLAELVLDLEPVPLKEIVAGIQENVAQELENEKGHDKSRKEVPPAQIL